MYIPKIKQKVGGEILGILIDPKTNIRYTGQFVKDYNGNYYKGTSITSKSESLTFVPDESIAREAGFYSDSISPTDKDYKKGFFIRYFAKDSRNGKIIEMNKRNYLAKQQEPKLYVRTAKVAWNITGELEDQKLNGYLYPGVRSKNIDVTKKAEEELPGIGTQILNNPDQFVR